MNFKCLNMKTNELERFEELPNIRKQWLDHLIS